MFHIASLVLPVLSLLAPPNAQPEVDAVLGWEAEAQHVWIVPTETDGAKPLHPTPISTHMLIETYEPPPRAAWCAEDGQQLYQPNPIECAEYDVDLEAWMLYFTDVQDPALLPQYDYPPTFCGC